MNCPCCGESRDYIPGGKPANEISKLRPADGYYRCAVPTSYDIQSGPIFCGDRATLIADAIEGGVAVGLVAVCKRHEKVLRDMEKKHG